MSNVKSEKSQKTKEEIQRERVKKFKEHPNTKKVVDNYKLIFNIVNLTSLGVLVASLLTQWDFFILVLLLGVVLFGLAVIFKDLVDAKIKEKVPLYFKVGLSLIVCNLIAYALGFGLSDVFPKQITMMISFIGVFITAILMVALYKKPKFQEGIEKMMEKNIFDEMLGEEIKDGDAILGVNLETGKPVVLPYADRFLHMLALGATGTGKTAMTLTPMAFRDINNPNMGFTVIEPKGN